MKSYVIHILRAMPSQGALEGRYVGRAQSPLPMGAVAELAGIKREYEYPKWELYCASPAVSCVDTLKILYPEAEPEVVLELAELEKEGVGDDVLGDGLKFLIQEAFLHCPRSAGQILMTLL